MKHPLGDDIINRMRSITMADLEQKAQRLPNQFTLAIDESVTLAENNLSATVSNGSMSQEQLVELLEPALRILTNHSNMKPHLDNGMNQNGIYYNSDYFRLYLAFEQFQRTFAILFPNEVMKVPDTAGAGSADGGDNTSSTTAAAAAAAAERDKDRERNANMKAYRVWIEPLLTETNWAAFRRNIVVGERMMQLTKLVGQGVLLMTKELSGSKLHLTFTNSEWDEFINGLQSGRWDQTIEWENGQKKQFGNTKSLLVSELQLKFATHFWFYPDGSMVSSKERRLVIHASTVTSNNTNSTMLLHRNSMGDPSSLMHTHHPQQQQHLHTHHWTHTIKYVSLLRNKNEEEMWGISQKERGPITISCVHITYISNGCRVQTKLACSICIGSPPFVWNGILGSAPSQMPLLLNGYP